MVDHSEWVLLVESLSDNEAKQLFLLNLTEI